MKSLILISTLVFFFSLSCSSNSSKKEAAEFKVSGNCELCKARIEKAAKVDGVLSAEWNMETKVLKVEYLPAKIKVETMHKNIAKVGHDTEKEKADEEAYNKLPDCCKYERDLQMEQKKIMSSEGHHH